MEGNASKSEVTAPLCVCRPAWNATNRLSTRQLRAVDAPDLVRFSKRATPHGEEEVIAAEGTDTSPAVRALPAVQLCRAAPRGPTRRRVVPKGPAPATGAVGGGGGNAPRPAPRGVHPPEPLHVRGGLACAAREVTACVPPTHRRWEASPEPREAERGLQIGTERHAEPRGLPGGLILRGMTRGGLGKARTQGWVGSEVGCGQA